jgi:putative FmdB family regulatory protein
MPIYEYQCQVCGHQTEILQKVNEKPLVKCSECGRQKMRRLVSATAFQLKGEGWYVTDFRDKDKKTKKPETTENVASEKATGSVESTKAENTKVENSSDKSPKDVVSPAAKKAEKKIEKEK